jgi:chromosome segregation ATPase
VVSHAQSPQAAEGISSTDLVKEIHLIRAFLEASHKDNARLEVLLNRYRLQHDTVASISDRLEYIRDELATVDNDIAAASTKAGDFQVSSNAVSSTDAEVKPQLESQLNDSQAVLQDLKSRQTRLLAQQSRLSSALNTEQNRVRVLEDALDAIAPTR